MLNVHSKLQYGRQLKLLVRAPRIGNLGHSKGQRLMISVCGKTATLKENSKMLRRDGHYSNTAPTATSDASVVNAISADGNGWASRSALASADFAAENARKQSGDHSTVGGPGKTGQRKGRQNVNQTSVSNID